jgi:meiotically up-regulated gene 157 (Mug157) protein
MNTVAEKRDETVSPSSQWVWPLDVSHSTKRSGNAALRQNGLRGENAGSPPPPVHGNYQLYHDVNDLPTIYAPVWGFCHPHDEAWDRTLQFALSTQNKGGFYPGVFGGLGSVHTPHPWPLGDVQELLYAQVLGDQGRWQRVLQKLKRVVQWDGLFSEAINEETGQVESRHWFSWPGAFLSTVLLLLGNR